MIRASVKSEAGRTMILLGLEEGNVDRLRKGMPIHIHADELGFAGEIVIILGKDVTDLTEQLAPLIGPETSVRDYRERKPQ